MYRVEFRQVEKVIRASCQVVASSEGPHHWSQVSARPDITAGQWAAASNYELRHTCTHIHTVVFPSLQRTLYWLTFLSRRPNLNPCLTITLNQLIVVFYIRAKSSQSDCLNIFMSPQQSHAHINSLFLHKWIMSMWECFQVHYEETSVVWHLARMTVIYYFIESNL